MVSISIPLTQGEYALIDEEDFDLVRGYHWQLKRAASGKCYAQTTFAKGHSSGMRTLPLHRLILSAPTGMQVDHINGDGLDNRRANLRLATRSQNGINRSKPRPGTSQYKGVRFVAKRGGCWRAVICKDGQDIHIGYFDAEIEAAQQYDRAARQMFGEFARLNFPDDASTGAGLHE